MKLKVTTHEVLQCFCEDGEDGNKEIHLRYISLIVGM